ncbi:copper fist DNA binding domain-containing [Fusarium albosuccineum]|uniref:Copper fist DNA binding domain-containing n=1 Tax=Fusarium albosuccineum TaxID=1237068 RepID=A0A8H4P2Z6_9HYPO|nr:copper fist DNA binding domain-containing [Fusarium albosuccineum]
MIKDGEKFACETCIRGHRVAQCQHTDRPLQQSHSVHTRCKCGLPSSSRTKRAGKGESFFTVRRGSPLTKLSHMQSRAVAAMAKLVSVPTRKNSQALQASPPKAYRLPWAQFPHLHRQHPVKQPQVTHNRHAVAPSHLIGGLGDWSPDTFLESLGATSDDSLMSHSPGWMNNLTPLPDMNLDQSSVDNILPMLDYSLQGIDSTSLADDINKLPDLNLYGNLGTADFDWNPPQLMTADDSNQAPAPASFDPSQAKGTTGHDAIWPTAAGVTPADVSAESITKPIGFDIDSSVFSPEEFLLFYGEPH